MRCIVKCHLHRVKEDGILHMRFIRNRKAILAGIMEMAFFELKREEVTL